MNQRPTAMIVAPPGLLREGLRAALNALCCLEIVGEADSAAHAVAMTRDPNLVLLSVHGPENDSPTAIRAIKSQWPAARCVVLVETVAQQQAARDAGADQALIKGIRPAKLLRCIEGLLDEKQRTGAGSHSLAPSGHYDPEGTGCHLRLAKRP